ncbi:serine protease family protein [Gluconobacter wancherniae]|nr:hypothetical protein [Gluconobacter wancherniae]MBF0853634.1 hypothetical protein [Gluconobacter wancherniae]MBS1088987.1 hypothetical protein [Gluconobacter wancherniae]
MTSQIRAHETPLFLHPIRHWRPLLSSVLLTMVVACSPYRPIQRAENDFALAGFKAHPADTTARWQMMNLLPANTLTYRMKENQAVMLYADPTACGCVYMGSPAAYRAYMGSHKINLLDERHMTAEINQHPGWDWSVWNNSADPDVVSGIRPSSFQPVY